MIKKVKAFTLIELLVVISIIALLIAILRVKCMSNLRQVFNFLDAYGSDHAGFTPVAGDVGAHPNPPHYTNGWASRLAAYSMPTAYGPPSGWADAEKFFTSGAGVVFNCPFNEPALRPDENFLTSQDAGKSYRASASVFGARAGNGDVYESRSTWDIPKPSLTYLLIEHWSGMGVTGLASDLTGFAWRGTDDIKANPDWGGANYKAHPGGEGDSSYLFTDGHVKVSPVDFAHGKPQFPNSDKNEERDLAYYMEIWEPLP